MNKQVICEIDGQFFGLDSLLVRSIENGKAEMILEGAPNFCEGIIKFRGEWVPLIRLRTLLNIDKSEEPRLSQIIYLKTGHGTFGYRVDKTVEIDNIDDGDLQKIPIIVNSGKTAYVAGACSHHGRLIVIVNHDKLMSENDLSNIKNGLKAVYEAEEAERRRKEEEERRKAEEEEARKKAEEEEAGKKAKEEGAGKKPEEEAQKETDKDDKSDKVAEPNVTEPKSQPENKNDKPEGKKNTKPAKKKK